MGKAHSGARHGTELPLSATKQGGRSPPRPFSPCFASRFHLELLNNICSREPSTATQQTTTTWLTRTPTPRLRRQRSMRHPSPTPTLPAATPSRSSLPSARTAQSSSRVGVLPCPALPCPLPPYLHKLTACVLLSREHPAGYNCCPGTGRKAEGGSFLAAWITAPAAHAGVNPMP